MTSPWKWQGALVASSRGTVKCRVVQAQTPAWHWTSPCVTPGPRYRVYDMGMVSSLVHSYVTLQSSCKWFTGSSYFSHKGKYLLHLWINAGVTTDLRSLVSKSTCTPASGPDSQSGSCAVDGWGESNQLEFFKKTLEVVLEERHSGCFSKFGSWNRAEIANDSWWRRDTEKGSCKKKKKGNCEKKRQVITDLPFNGT